MRKIQIRKVERKTSITREIAKAAIDKVFSAIPPKEWQKLEKLKSKKAA